MQESPSSPLLSGTVDSPFNKWWSRKPSDKIEMPSFKQGKRYAQLQEDETSPHDSHHSISLTCAHQSCSLDTKNKENFASRAAFSQLRLVFGICIFFMIAELVGGYVANSLAIMSDAAHLAADAAGYGISMLAIWYGMKGNTSVMTWGYARVELVGALTSILMLWIVLILLIQEGIHRLQRPEDVDGPTMLYVSSGGFLVNVLMGFILVSCGHGHSHGLQKCDGNHGPGETDSHDFGYQSPRIHSTSVQSGDGSAENPIHHDAKSHHGHSHDAKSHHEHSHDCKKAHGHDHHGHASSQTHHGHDCSHHHGHTESLDEQPHHGHSHQTDCQQLPTSSHEPHQQSTSHHGHSHQHGRSCDHHAIDLHHGEGKFKHSKQNINVRAAFIHVIADGLQSLGVVIASALIWYDEDRFLMADPICTILFSTVGFLFSLTTIRDIFRIILMAAPLEISVDSLKLQILDVDKRIQGIHCLHVWSIGVENFALAAHLSTNSTDLNHTQVLQKIEAVAAKFGISHTTIQIETVDMETFLSPR